MPERADGIIDKLFDELRRANQQTLPKRAADLVPYSYFPAIPNIDRGN
jgi:hypothetical protein